MSSTAKSYKQFLILLKFLTFHDNLLFISGSLASVIIGIISKYDLYLLNDLWQIFINKERIRKQRELGSYNLTGISIDDDLDENELNSRLFSICSKLFYFSIMIAILSFFKRSIFMAAAENICYRIKKKAFQTILSQEMEWFEENKPGVLSTTIFESTEKLYQQIGVTFAWSIRNFTAIIAGFYVAFTINPHISVYVFVFCLFTIALIYWADRLSESDGEDTYQKAGRILGQALGSIRTVQAHNGERYELERYKEALWESSRKDIWNSILIAMSGGMFSAYHNSFDAFSYWMAADYVFEGLISATTVITVCQAVQSATVSFGDLINDLLTIRKVLSESKGLIDILELDSRTNHLNKMSKELDEIKNFDRLNQITFQNVDFAYTKRPKANVLKKVSFSCEPGQTVAIVGSSGAGKSTIVKLLLKFYEPSNGDILINEYSIKELDKRQLRDLIGIVGQEPALFNTSILENVRYGSQEATEAEIMMALQKANALEFVKDLPKGWFTLVGDRGCQLSGGQKQRIAIARAIIKNPKILLLDEATSALDSESEKEVLRALEKASKGRTTVVIAHRLSTIKKAHQIIVLNKGEVVESGTHSELMAMNGHYMTLVKTQTNQQMVISKRRSTEECSEGDLEDREEIHFSEDQQENQLENEILRLKRECKEESVTKASFRDILQEVRPDRKFLLMGVCACFYEGLSMPLNRWIETNALESFSSLDPQKQRESGHFAALLSISLILPDFIFICIKYYGFEKTAVNLSSRLRINLFSNLLHQNGPYYDDPRHSPARLGTRIAKDAYLTRQDVSIKLSYVIRGAIGLIIGLFSAFYYCWPLSTLMIPVLPFIAFLWIVWELFEAEDQVDQKLIEECGRVMSESIENISVVQSSNLEEIMQRRFSTLLEKPHKDNYRRLITTGMVKAVSECTFAITLAIEYYLAGWIMERGTYKPFDIFRAMVIMNSVGESLGFILSYLPEYRKSRLAAGLFFKNLKDTTVPEETATITTKCERIEFHDVKFAYPQRSQVEILKGVSFSVERGEKVALVGGSGCGKSTVTQLIQRFYDSNEGKILINGVDISRISRRELRSKIGLVSQEPTLFDDTIMENIRYGLPRDLISKEKVIEAAQSANIHSFIESLPDGYETIVGERGTLLSGGQKQRIAIARALIRDPEFLILDEATSALDAESERVVQEALDAAAFGRSCLVIAHRLSTIQNADKIVVIHDGRVVEQGTHLELLKLHSVYYNLVKHQNQV